MTSLLAQVLSPKKVDRRAYAKRDLLEKLLPGSTNFCTVARRYDQFAAHFARFVLPSFVASCVGLLWSLRPRMP